MNRSRYVRRLVRDPETGEIIRVPEGDEAANQLAFALATTCSVEFLEAMLHHKSALDEFGGSVFIAASRMRFDDEGNPVEHSEPGAYHTAGYAWNYSKKSRLPQTADEPDSELATVEPERNGDAPPVEIPIGGPEIEE